MYQKMLILIVKCNNTYHRTIKIKYDSCAEYNVDSNEKEPKFKDGDHVRKKKNKNIFPKGYTPNWPEEVPVISKFKNKVP